MQWADRKTKVNLFIQNYGAEYSLLCLFVALKWHSQGGKETLKVPLL